MIAPPLIITNEQVNSLPLLLGIITEMGMRDLIDTHVRPHGNWEGASVGSVLSIWLSHILQERDHRLVSVRDWAADRAQTINTLLDISLRATDCTDDRLATILRLLGDPSTQAALDAALLTRWVRVYRLSTTTVRLDSTSVSVYHEGDNADSLLQHGYSKEHRPDLRQFKLMLPTLDPLGLPLCCQPIAGNRGDDGLYVPAYDAAVQALGTSALLVVGDSKMGALPTRGHLVAAGSCYLCAYRPIHATAEIADWVSTALAHQDDWLRLESVDPSSGEVQLDAVGSAWERPQRWTSAASEQPTIWTERVLLVRASAYQAGLLRLREQALARLTTDLLKLAQPPSRGRKRYATEADLAHVVAKRIAEAKLEGVLQTAPLALTLADGSTAWVLAAVWVDLAAWQAMVERLGWQVYVSNTTAEQYDLPTLVAVYHQQAIHERGFSRLKTRNLKVRPIYLRDERRIAGLIWLLCLALRVLTLTEYRLRTALQARGEQLAGLNPASHSQTSAQPSTERVLAAFRNLTLTVLPQDGMAQRHISPLNRTQQHILDLLGLPPDLYAGLGALPANLLPQLRE
ncbi:MAG TPA: IS1634 family transposase [Roseiflexaceae bacterium]|nr:IS1634 family transposase [Roseiflexaceae bacterium]